MTSNADLVREGFERWNARDHESLLAQIDPDIEIVVASAQISGGGPFRGHEGYRQWIRTMEESFDVWQISPTSFSEDGDRVLVLGHMRVRGRVSGVELVQETGWVVDVRDGKMTRFQAYLSHEEARVAGGIS